MATNSFNLIDEKWITTVDKGPVSLRDIFSDSTIKQLGGSTIEKLSIFKLLLSIAQAAYTPVDDDDWCSFSLEEMSSKICSYLDKHYNKFFLYSDDNPFLQFPVLSSKTELKPFSIVQPHVASGNTTVRTQSECSYEVDVSESARILISLMSFAFGGKQVDNTFSLTEGYCKKKSGRVGVGLSYLGYLHSYFLGNNLIETIKLNLLTNEDVISLNIFPSGIGTPLWEKMPEGEDDDIAKAYKQSLLGRLVGLGRFCLLEKNGLFLTEGFNCLDHQDGVCDPAVTIDKSKLKAVWCDPDKAPWRSLPAILSFISVSQPSVICQQLQLCMKRVCQYPYPVAIWSLGQKVSSISGEFRVLGRDDSVDSVIWMDRGDIFSEAWYEVYASEIESLEQLSKMLCDAITGYLIELKKPKKTKEEASKYIHLFWESIEPFAQKISDSCDDLEKRKVCRQRFAQIAKSVYDKACPCYTAKQLKAWSKHKLNTNKYEQIGENN